MNTGEDIYWAEKVWMESELRKHVSRWLFFCIVKLKLRFFTRFTGVQVFTYIDASTGTKIVEIKRKKKMLSHFICRIDLEKGKYVQKIFRL